MDQNIESLLMKELKILDYELDSMRENARVFVRQKNSNVYFLTTRTAAKEHVRTQQRMRFLGQSVAN